MWKGKSSNSWSIYVKIFAGQNPLLNILMEFAKRLGIKINTVKRRRIDLNQ
jgi:hypothetical protein